MRSLSILFILSIAASLADLAGVLARPFDTRSSASTGAPRWVAYWDYDPEASDGQWPEPETFKGYTTLILGFWLTTGAADQALAWQTAGGAIRSQKRAAYNTAGISLMVSAFGSTEEPTSSGAGANKTAKDLAGWVKTYGLDGVDVDYEDLTAMTSGHGIAEDWLIAFTQSLRRALPSEQYIITHAPVAPWFSPVYTAGAYTKVHAQAGHLIDWYNVQFYNQGDSEYTTCSGLLHKSSSVFPSTSVFEIYSTANVTLNKIVIGKPATSTDATNGYMDLSTLSMCIQTAKSSGWTAGVMVWEYPHADAKWIAAVRKDSWPVGAPTTSTTRAVISTTTRTGQSVRTSSTSTEVSSTSHVVDTTSYSPTSSMSYNTSYPPASSETTTVSNGATSTSTHAVLTTLTTNVFTTVTTTMTSSSSTTISLNSSTMSTDTTTTSVPDTSTSSGGPQISTTYSTFITVITSTITTRVPSSTSSVQSTTSMNMNTSASMSMLSSTSTSAVVSTTSTASPPGACSGVPVWNETEIYSGGDEVQYNYELYSALLCNAGIMPGMPTTEDVWIPEQAC